MSEKENILARIREALQIAAPSPGHSPAPLQKTSFSLSSSGGEGRGEEAVSKNTQRWLPQVGPTFDEQLSLFRKNALELKAELHLLNSADDLSNASQPAPGRRRLEKDRQP